MKFPEIDDAMMKAYLVRFKKEGEFDHWDRRHFPRPPIDVRTGHGPEGKSGDDDELGNDDADVELGNDDAGVVGLSTVQDAEKSKKIILGKKVRVDGLVAQVVHYDDADEKFLLFYPDHGNKYEGVNFEKENRRWELVQEKNKRPPKVSALRDRKNWERFDVKYKGVECIYTFRGEAMFLVRPSTIPGEG